MMQKVLLITPPFTQLNTPYPATAYLKAFLSQQGIETAQCDLSIDVFLALFSRQGLSVCFEMAHDKKELLSENSLHIVEMADAYLDTIDSVIAFLQGKRQTLAQLIADGDFLPQASRFEHTEDLDWAFGAIGLRDKAIHLCTLYLEDLGDLITEAVDPHFGFSRYAEQLGRCASSFDALQAELEKPLTVIDNLLITQLKQQMEQHNPTLVGITIPFPGNLYSALRCGEWIKANYPSVQIAMGGGFPNTELRSLEETRIFKYTDYILLDDGEIPMLQLIRLLNKEVGEDELNRTFVLRENKTVYLENAAIKDVSHAECGYPDYDGLHLDRYVSIIEIANPMHKLWSDGRWNKMTLAHGCYWGKCAFCDGSLDYIKRFNQTTAAQLADRMQAIMEQTGEPGFHFVDEAAPPALLKELCLEILRRRMKVVWWGNIRFERSFTADLCRLMKAAGCIAVSGGLEIASDRLLKLINKGVDVAQVARVANHFTQSGIMVHAYLMYGFPTQTAQETIDSMETVRQLFENEVVQSGFWHRFAMTAHSPVGLSPESFGAEVIEGPFGGFAKNDVQFVDKKGCDHGLFSEGLRVSLYNYMQGAGFDLPLHKWFDFKIPRTTLPPSYIERVIDSREKRSISPRQKIVWLGGATEIEQTERNRKGKKSVATRLVINNKTETLACDCTSNLAQFLHNTLPSLKPSAEQAVTLEAFAELLTDKAAIKLEDFLASPAFEALNEAGLLIV
ncbi:MAG: B12-binding domain-containing radical SAM protein [Tannerellaceae bacterium]